MQPPNLQVGPDGQKKGYYDKFGNFVPVLMLPEASQDPNIAGDVQSALMNAETSAMQTQPQNNNMSPEQQSKLPGLGAMAVTTLGEALSNPQYDYRAGMEKPAPFKTMTNLQATQMGSSFGPVGSAVGFGVDMIKNIISMKKQKSAYDAALRKADFTEFQNQPMQSDYTGMAKYGGQMMHGGKMQNGGPIGKQQRAEKRISKFMERKGITPQQANKAAIARGVQPFFNQQQYIIQDYGPIPEITLPGGTVLGNPQVSDLPEMLPTEQIKVLKKDYRQGYLQENQPETPTNLGVQPRSYQSFKKGGKSKKPKFPWMTKFGGQMMEGGQTEKKYK